MADLAKNIKDIQPGPFLRVSLQFTLKISDYFGKEIPRFLDNNEFGLSPRKQDENNQITAIAQYPQYAKLLLRSDAILPVLIADVTFQSSIYRGTIIIIIII